MSEKGRKPSDVRRAAGFWGSMDVSFDAGLGEGFLPFSLCDVPQLYIFARMCSIALFSRRETCACEIPISAAISICVFPR